MKNRFKSLQTLLLILSIAFSAQMLSAQGKGNGKQDVKGDTKGNSGKQDVSPGNQGKQDVKGNAGKEDPGNSNAGVKEDKGNANAEHGKSDAANGKAEDENGKSDEKHGNGEVKENQGQGNAYGKNKGELEGRDFGQDRAAAARAKTDDKVKEAATEIQSANTLKGEVQSTVGGIKLQVDEEVKAGKITKTQAEATRTKIQEVEAKIKALDDAVQQHEKLVESVKTVIK